MRLSTNALKATALALPLSFGALTAQAADITETIQQTDRLGTFYRALEAAGMVDTLQGGGPVTVFAPTDAAFEALPDQTVDALFADQDALRTLVGYHIVQGRAITSAELPEEVQTESGQLFVGVIEGAPVLARSEAYGASGTFPGGVAQRPVERTAGVDVEPETVEEEAGLVQDVETTSPSELQDEAPLAQERAAEETTALGTVGQGTAGEPETLTEMLDEDDEAVEQQQGAAATTGGAVGPTTYDPETVTGYFGEEPEEGVRFVQADIEADNGVVHVIDYVLVPNTVIEAMLR